MRLKIPYNFLSRISISILSVSEIYRKLFINLEFILRAVEAVAREECPVAEGSLEEQVLLFAKIPLPQLLANEC